MKITNGTVQKCQRGCQISPEVNHFDIWLLKYPKKHFSSKLRYLEKMSDFQILVKIKKKIYISRRTDSILALISRYLSVSPHTLHDQVG